MDVVGGDARSRLNLYILNESISIDPYMVLLERHVSTDHFMKDMYINFSGKNQT